MTQRDAPWNDAVGWRRLMEDGAVGLLKRRLDPVGCDPVLFRFCFVGSFLSSSSFFLFVPSPDAAVVKRSNQRLACRNNPPSLRRQRPQTNKTDKKKRKKRSRRNCREWTWNEKRHDAESISTRLPTETAIERHLFWFRFCFDWFRCGGGGGGVGSWSGSRVFSSSVPNEIKIKTKNKHYRLNSVLVGFIDLLSFRWHFFRRLVAFQFFQYRWPKADCLPNIELETN